MSRKQMGNVSGAESLLALLVIYIIMVMSIWKPKTIMIFPILNYYA